jgi:hypothetical protein
MKPAPQAGVTWNVRIGSKNFPALNNGELTHLAAFHKKVNSFFQYCHLQTLYIFQGTSLENKDETTKEK